MRARELQEAHTRELKDIVDHVRHTPRADQNLRRISRLALGRFGPQLQFGQAGYGAERISEIMPEDAEEHFTGAVNLLAMGYRSLA
jgi:hypothetical protein